MSNKTKKCNKSNSDSESPKDGVTASYSSCKNDKNAKKNAFNDCK